MLNKLQNFFKTYLEESDNNASSVEHRLQLATAALMVEVIHVDNQVTDDEQNIMRQLLEKEFQLNKDEIQDLLNLATEEKRTATDYFEFTSLLNKHYEPQQKVTLIEDLWALAYADQELDKHEEHLIRRLAELLHVPHHAFIKTKLKSQH